MNKNQDKIEKLVDSSGIITHQKIVQKLRSLGWYVQISPYYKISSTESSKEFDIIAEKPFNNSPPRESSIVQFNVQLFIECKYIKQEVVFWFDEIDINKAVVLNEEKYDISIVSPQRGSGDIKMEEIPNLSSKKVAKIFSTNLNKEDVIHKAVDQCLSAKIYYDQYKPGPLFYDFVHIQEAKTKIIRFPLVVCDNFNKLKEVEFENDSFYTNSIQDNFKLELNYSYPDKKNIHIEDYFLIDFIDAEKLEDFIKNFVEKEMQEIINS